MARTIQVGDGMGDCYCDGLWDPRLEIPAKIYKTLITVADEGGGAFDIAVDLVHALNDLTRHWEAVREYRNDSQKKGSILPTGEFSINGMIATLSSERLMEIYHILRGARFVLPKTERELLLPLTIEVEEHVEDLNLLGYEDNRLAEFNKNLHALAIPPCGTSILHSLEDPKGKNGLRLNIPCRGKVRFYRRGTFQQRNTITVLLAGPEDDQGFILSKANDLIGHCFNEVVIDDLIENRRTVIPRSTVVGWTAWETRKPGWGISAVLALRVPTKFNGVSTTASEIPTYHYDPVQLMTVPRSSLKIRKIKEINKLIEETVTRKTERIIDVWMARLMLRMPIPGIPSFETPVPALDPCPTIL